MATGSLVLIIASLALISTAFTAWRIFGHPRFLLRGLQGAQAEISLATTVYNLKRMLNVLGANRLRAALAG
jgi:hypothetical protein